MKHIAMWSVATSLVLVLAAGARGQERVSDQLALARICASEIGLSGAPEECAAISSVLHRRAELRDWTFGTAARLYSSRVFDTSRTDRRAWVASLRADGRRPSGWPTTVVVRRGGQQRTVSHAPWVAFRERWMTLYEAAGRVLSGEVVSACGAAEVDHWGMRSGIDLERATRAGWAEVECTLADGSRTRNAFWQVRRLAEID